MWLATSAVVFAASQAPETSDERFSMPGIEAQKAYDLADERFPGATADGATARVVFVAPDGQKVTASDSDHREGRHDHREGRHGAGRRPSGRQGR
ncbi:hypothetical protein [Streptomyces sp. AF1A]|jgi:RND superfamily putative drug exporter|uniref:hypothetical protein n=1 Tax=Streptomyces sp. AF1A TaxID=3394350 RepID=UPI0039BC6687